MIVIPDVHGRSFWCQAFNEYLGKEHILFLGDYLDPYAYEGITPAEIAERLNSMWLDTGKRPLLLRMMGDVSYSRWGNRPYGSPVWNDVDDLATDHEEVPGYIQVFGHTQQMSKPVICDYYMCLDVRSAFRLGEELSMLAPRAIS